MNINFSELMFPLENIQGCVKMMSPWHGKAAASVDSSAGFELTAELKYEFDVKDLGLLTPGAPAGPLPSLA